MSLFKIEMMQNERNGEYHIMKWNETFDVNMSKKENGIFD